MRAAIGGLIFEGGDGDSPFTIVPDGLKGWLGGSGMRRDTLDRPAQHGAFALPGYLPGRLITIEGEVYSGSEWEQKQHLAQLSGLLADGGYDALTVTIGQDTLRARVGLQGCDSEIDRWGLLASFQLTLWSPDPRRYGRVEQFTGGTVEVFHYGNFAAAPVVEVHGPISGYTISGPGGAQYIVTQQLLTGQTHRIDFLTGRIYRDGALQTGAVSRAQTWAVPAGTPVTMSISAGQMTVTMTDTYI